MHDIALGGVDKVLMPLRALMGFGPITVVQVYALLFGLNALTGIDGIWTHP